MNRKTLSSRDFDTLQEAILAVYASHDLPAICSRLPQISAPWLPEGRARRQRLLELLSPHLERARRNAISVPLARSRPMPSLASFGLTRREREVAQRLAQGMTNAEISVILLVGSRTVEKHVENILRKLSVENRTAAALLLVALE